MDKNNNLTLNKKALSEINLSEIILQCQSGNIYAMEELVKRNQKIVYSIIYHLIYDKSNVSDLTQEVLYRICKSIKSLKNPSSFKSWLSQIINNIIYDELRRKQKKLVTISIDNVGNTDDETPFPQREIADSTNLPDETACNIELNERIKSAIENLPEQFRQVIVYRELQGLSYEEIAKITETNIGTVKSRIARARGRLQEELKPYIDRE